MADFLGVGVGTLMVIAILLLVTTAFWMMVLGVQQGRA